jgi:hypothetical protein
MTKKSSAVAVATERFWVSLLVVSLAEELMDEEEEGEDLEETISDLEDNFSAPKEMPKRVPGW